MVIIHIYNNMVFFKPLKNRRMGKQSYRGFCLIQRQNVLRFMCSCLERKSPLDKEEKQFLFVIIA
ncbi:hypothetical protein IMY05_007G0104600 [Salix suchowensis]|nr:hypothetical protein IMY05_007G0104600 [Salix suchowensis]